MKLRSCKIDIDFQDKSLTKYIEISDFAYKLLRFSLFSIFLLLIFLLFVKWVPSVSGLGTLIAFYPNDRVQNLESPIEGRIERWNVNEGDLVGPGDLLVEITDIDPNRIDRLKNTLDALEDKLIALEKTQKRQEKHVERMGNLFEKGIESKRNYELAEIEVFKTKTEINKVNVSVEDLKSRLAQQSAQVVTSPTKGVVTDIYKPVNTTIVKTGDVLAKIVPVEVTRAVEIFIEGRDFPFIRKGQKTRVSFEGWPLVQIIGWPSLAVGTFGGIVEVINQGAEKNGKYRIVIKEDPSDPWPNDNIVMGTRSKVWIQLRKVPLWWELWRRFSGVPPSV